MILLFPLTIISLSGMISKNIYGRHFDLIAYMQSIPTGKFKMSSIIIKQITV